VGSSRGGVRGTPERLAQAIAAQVVNLVVDALDIDALLRRIDPNTIMARVDVNALLEHIDMNAVLDKIDVNALVAEVDIDTLLQRIQLETLITRSTTSAMGATLDVIRRQGVGLDDFVARHVDRLLRRSPDIRPNGPGFGSGSVPPATGEGANQMTATSQ
jgi:hypothetical protein